MRNCRTALLGGMMIVSLMVLGTPGEAMAQPQSGRRVTVTAESVTVSQTHGEGEVLTEALQGADFDVVEEFEDGWIQVEVGGETGYIRNDGQVSVFDVTEELLEEGGELTEEAGDEEETGLEEEGPGIELEEDEDAEVSDERTALVEYAMQFLGGKYASNGNDPHTGVDCSGFTSYVMKYGAGVSVGRSSVAQSGSGVEVSAEEMQPGDLVFYAKNGRINHVALYIGDGQVIHASTYKTGIKLSPWTYRTPVKIVSVLSSEA